MAKENPLASYAKSSSVGIEFAVAAVVGLVGGSYVDSHFGTGPWGVIIGSILGLVTGFYRLITAFQEKSSQSEQQNDRKD